MKKFLIIVGLILLTWKVVAELTAVVSPGYSFSSAERPTTSTLNLLGRPTVLVYGTIDGSNGVSPNSISGDQLVSGFPGTNLTWDGSSPRKLVVANSGIWPPQISTTIAGDGLTGGAGTALSVVVDGTTIVITNDTVTLGSNVQPANISGFTNTVYAIASSAATNAAATNRYVSPLLVLGANTVVTNVAHGLGATPTIWKWVLVCQTADAGYAIGDEIGVESIEQNGDVNTFVAGANATNVFLIQGVGTEITTKAGVENSDITLIRWRAKCYARP